MFGKKEEDSVVLGDSTEEVDLNKIYDSEEPEEPEEPEETVQHCGSHLRFKKNCPDCLRAVGII